MNTTTNACMKDKKSFFFYCCVGQLFSICSPLWPTQTRFELAQATGDQEMDRSRAKMVIIGRYRGQPDTRSILNTSI